MHYKEDNADSSKYCFLFKIVTLWKNISGEFGFLASFPSSRAIDCAWHLLQQEKNLHKKLDRV